MPILIAIIIALVVGAGALWYIAPTDTSNESSPAEISRPLNEEVSEAPAANLSTTPENTNLATTENETGTTESPAATASTEFANGSYTSRAEYITPARTRHQVALTITLANDVIVAANVEYDDKPAGSFSNSNQERFHSSYPELVIGNSPQQVSLSRVGGASLTSQAFNEALEQIQADARL